MNIVTRTLLRSVNRAYCRNRGVSLEELQAGRWVKSSASSYNGNCVQILKLSDGRVAVRDTKDKGKGPALILDQEQWEQFLSSSKASAE
jgi:Domain of unknown function (DUF397)